MKLIMGLLILLNTIAFGVAKEVEADMRKEGNLLVITLSAEKNEEKEKNEGKETGIFTIKEETSGDIGDNTNKEKRLEIEDKKTEKKVS